MGGRPIIFYAFSSQSWDSYFPILVELLSCDPSIENRISVCAPCDHYDFRSEASKQLFDLFHARYEGPPSSKGGQLTPYPYVLVTTHIPDPALGLSDGFYVHVPHGSGFGNSESQDYVLSCFQAANVYCGISPAELLFIREVLGSEVAESVPFVATGCPKNDMFASYVEASEEERAQLRAQIKQSLKIPADQAVVFIASHWTPSGLLRKFGTGLIQALSALGDQVRIIQGSHPNLWNQHVSAQTSQWIYQSLCREVDRGAVALSLGVSDATALLASDVVVADVSSIVIEAALLEKPLMLHIDRQSFRSDEVYQIYSGVGIQFSGADDLVQSFLRGVSFPEKRTEMLRKNKELFGYNLGGASKKVAEVILSAARDPGGL